jgi:tetratricopeptide (TPR) repeat protein
MTGIFIALLIVAIVGGVTYFLQRRSARRSTARKLSMVDRKLAAGDYVEAITEIDRTIDYERDASLQFAMRVRKARALVGIERYEDAAHVCSELASSSRASTERADAHVQRARALAEAGRFDEASADLETARSLGCSIAGRLDLELVTADIALCRRAFADAERALAAAFDAAGRGPRASEVTLGHARIQLLRGSFRQCVGEINRIVEDLGSDDLQALALVTTARALLEQDIPDVAGADGALSRATLIVHHQGIAAIAMATYSLAQAHFGNLQEALSSAECAAGMTRSARYSAEAYCIAGDAFLVLHCVAEARTSYQMALTIDPSSAEALWGLGRCAQDFGLFEVAEGYYRFCVASAPDHYAAHRSEAALER